jgi:hypothetical protein
MNVILLAGATVGETTVGQRVYLVRLACGDGVRKAMPMREFADLLSGEGEGETFHPSRLSDIENDKSPPSIEEIRRIAAVDPGHRGRAWLAWGIADEGKSEAPPVRPPLRFEQPSDTVDLPDRRPAAKKRRKGNHG